MTKKLKFYAEGEVNNARFALIFIIQVLKVVTLRSHGSCHMSQENFPIYSKMYNSNLLVSHDCVQIVTYQY